LPVGHQLGDVHDDGRERFGADVRSFYQSKGEKERSHERAHTPQESREEAGCSPNYGEGLNWESSLGARLGVSPEDHEQEEGA